MMNCPLCGTAAHTRSSYQITKETKERYYQCQNLNCGCTFKSHETLSDFIMRPGAVKYADPHPASGGQECMNF